MADGRAALLQRVHHTVTDGVGGLKLSLSLVDFERDPEPNVHDTVRALADEEQGRQLHEALEDPLEPRLAARSAARRDGLRVQPQRRSRSARHQRSVPTSRSIPLRRPGGPQDAIGLVASLRRQVLVGGGPRSPLLATRSLGRRYDVFAVSLEECRSAAHALGGSINDVFVTGVTGALGLYHDRLGTPVDDLRMAMAVSTRSGDSAEGNQFVPTRVIVPITPKEPAERFHQVRDRITNVRHEPALSAADGFAAVAAGLPTSLIVGLLRSQTRTTDFATSNLRGSPIELYIGGAAHRGQLPDGTAQRVRDQRDRVVVLRRALLRHPLRPGGDHRSRRVRGVPARVVRRAAGRRSLSPVPFAPSTSFTRSEVRAGHSTAPRPSSRHHDRRFRRSVRRARDPVRRA